MTLSLAGCGKSGDPLPPIRNIPKAATDFEVVQRGNELWLDFAYPQVTAAGTPLVGLEGFTLYSATTPSRIGAPISTPTTGQFTSLSKPLFSVSAEELGPMVLGDRIRARLALPASDAEAITMTLGLRTQAAGGETSGWSNLITFAPRRQSFPAPTELLVEGKVAGVLLNWSYPEEAVATAPTELEESPAADDADEKAAPSTDSIDNSDDSPKTDTPVSPAVRQQTQQVVDETQERLDGFRIYRRNATDRVFGPPLRTLPPTARTFVDRGAVLGQKYIYAITAVARRKPVVVESALGGEATLDYRDRFPPPVPEGVVALVDAGTVRLLWSSVEAADLAGYLVYRGTSGVSAKDAVRLTASALTAPEFIDSGTSPGQTLTYWVTAVDQEGNESQRSTPTAARLR